MSMDEQQAFLYDVGGRQTAVAHGAVEQFERDHPDAYRLSLFDDGSGTPRIVAQENAEAFRRENPGAQPVHLFDVDGRPRAVARSALGGFLEEARAKEQARMDGPKDEKKSVARDLLDVAASRAGAAGLGVATAPGELLGGVASAVGGVDRSTPQGRAVREHQERGDTWNGVTQSWDRAQPTISADRRSWAKRQWDKVIHGGFGADRQKGRIGSGGLEPMRGVQQFNDALVELGHGLRDWREGTKARPTTIAGEVAAPVADTAATLGKYALLAPTGLGGGVMAAEGASESLARTEGRADLSATDRLALAAAGGAANAAIYGVAGAKATAPVSEAILRRASSGAAGQLVSGGGARMAADALKMGAASAAGDIAAAEPVDVRRAAQAAQEGALIGFASGAAASAPRAIEASARETARRMQDPATEAARLREAAEARYVEAQRGRAAEAASELAGVNPAATLGRIADEIPADLAQVGENLEAAAVPESPMDAYARRRRAAESPASDYAGSAGREFLARGARDLERREVEAARLAEEELATREAPQVAPEEVPPTVAPEVRPGNTGNTGKEPPASGGASRPGEPQSPAPAPVAESATPPPQAAPRTLKEATDRIAELRAERKRLNGVGYNFADPNWEKMKAEDEADRQRLDAEIEKAEAGLDALRAPAVPLRPSGVTPALNPKAAAKVAERFAATDDARPILTKPYHDKETGYVVATDGRRLIATRHGFDPNAPTPNGVFPRWKQVAVMDGYGKDALRETLDVRALADMAEGANKLARASSVRRDLGAQVALRIGGKPVMVDAGYFADFLRAMEANGVSEVEWDGRGPIVARNADTTIMLMPLRVTDDFEVQTGRNKGGGVLVDAATGRIVRAPGRDDWRDDWKDENLRPKKDPAKSTLDRMAAAQDEIEIRIMRRDEALRAMDGFGRRGVDPLQDARGRRPSRGRARGDVAAETPRLAGTAAGVKPATPDGPRAAIRSELQVLLDSGEKDPATLEGLARRAEAADAFETAALARQAAGTYRGSPWNTEGGNWPHEEPPAARASFGDLFTLARNLGEGRAPEFVRRISRLPWAEGVFRFDEGDPASGRVQERSGLLRLVPDARIEAIRSEAQAEAAAKGLSPEQAQTLFSRKLRSAIQESAFAGPKPAMAVLAHEIGHWVDFLDEGTLKRGNVLGHIAALKRWGQRQIYPTKAAADAAGFPGLTRAEVKAKAKEWKVSEGEARRRLVEERDMAALPDLRREMESLVAWYRQSDGAPEYFRSSPSELYAEAFSAWVNYPAEVARRAPAFAAVMDGWLDARPEAARALREFRDGVTQAEARAAKAAGDVTNPAFFAALDQESGAARRAEDLAGRLTDEALRGKGGAEKDVAWAKAKLAFSGPDDILKGELMRSAQGAFDAHNLPLWRAMQQKDNANNRMVLWDYRFRTHVAPLLQGVPHETFLNYLYHSRVANELLGPDATRGRMNLPNTNGLTPGDVSRAQGNAQTSSAAWLNELRRTHPEIAEKCERARREFWAKVRNGGDELGGEGSPMDVIRNSPCLSAEQKAALLGNEWYVAFRPAVVPDVSRAVSTGEMSVWDGIFSQRTGSEKPVGDVLANTLLQDLTMQDQLLRQEYRLRAVDWLRNNKSEWVGERVEPVFDKATGRASVPQREKTGWRVVAFLRNGKPEGWWVRDFIADALAPKPHQVSSLEGWRGLANKSARGINALKTTLNPAFGVANTLKDAFSIALRQLPSGTSGAGHAAALLNGARNWLGDYGAMFRSFGDTSAADIIHGKWNADAARALAWGALNNAAPNQSAYAGGGEKGGVGELAARYRELGRSEVSDKDLRAALKTFGYSERQISGALDRTESRLVSALREAARVTGARWAAEQHGRVMSFLSRGEIRTKSFALAEAMRRRPDLTREEAVQWVHDMIGTPAMNNRPALAKLPGIGHVVPFLTPRVHGWTDQLYGALRSGWTGGPGQSAQVASRIAFATTMMAIPLAAVGILRGEAEEAEKRGDKERAAALRGMARRWQAIPSTDILTGICFPNPLGKSTHIKIPVDPTIIPIAGIALEKIFGGGGKNLAPGAGMEQFTGDLLPTVGTAPTLYLGNRSGRDPNTGRQVVGERTPSLDRALWNWDQLTARGLGMLPGSMLRAWMAGSEDAREMERATRTDQIPVVSALWRPFLRRSGYGLVERANRMRELDSADGKRAQKDSEAIAAGKQLPPDEEEWYYSHVTDPDGMIDRAAERADRLRTMTPDERAFEGLPAIRADEIAERAGYIAPPRLTDEDRNR